MSRKHNVYVIILNVDQATPLGFLQDLLDGLETDSDVGEKETAVEPEVIPEQKTRRSRSVKRKSAPKRKRTTRKDSSIGTARKIIAKDSNLPLDSVHLYRPDGIVYRDEEKVDVLRKDWEAGR